MALAAEITAWMGMLALHGHDARRWEPKTLRFRLFTIPATLARSGRRVRLHLAARAPFARLTLDALERVGRERSDEFAVYTKTNGITRSVGRTGICYDNAWAESFNATLKNERVHRTVYATRERAIADITKWIELRYNHKRLHSGLEYRTPDEVEAEWYATQQAA